MSQTSSTSSREGLKSRARAAFNAVVAFVLCVGLMVPVYAPADAYADTTDSDWENYQYALEEDSSILERYNHGSIEISSEDAEDNVIDLEVGETATIVVEPYQHVQYTGCRMFNDSPSCPSSCSEYTDECFVVGYGCRCDMTPALVTATIDVDVTGSAASVSDDIQVSSSLSATRTYLGQTNYATLTVTAEKAGTSTVTVDVDGLYFWIPASTTYTVNVTGDSSDDSSDDEKSRWEDYCEARESGAIDGFSHGDIEVAAEDAEDNVITLEAGQTATIVIAPYQHVQYEGCDMSYSYCPRNCGTGDDCFVVGYGCKCGTSPSLVTATVDAASADSSIASVSDEVAISEELSATKDMLGQTNYATLTVTAVDEGKTTVSVDVDGLFFWTPASTTYTVEVVEGEAEEEEEEEDVITHNLVEVPAVAATCTTAGNRAYYQCSDCGLLFIDAEGTIETTLEEETIAALGHDWDYESASWTWSDDYSSATATLSCANDSSHTTEVAATVSATSNADGSTTYTATISDDDGNEYSTSYTTEAAAEEEDDSGSGDSGSGDSGMDDGATDDGAADDSGSGDSGSDDGATDDGATDGDSDSSDEAAESITVDGVVYTLCDVTYTATGIYAALGDTLSEMVSSYIGVSVYVSEQLSDGSYNVIVFFGGASGYSDAVGDLTIYESSDYSDAGTAISQTTLEGFDEPAYLFSVDSPADTIYCSLSVGGSMGMDITYSMDIDWTAPEADDSEAEEEEEAEASYDFTDVQDEGLYYYDAVYALAEAGIITGVSDTLYGVNQNMTRAQFATIIYRIAGEPSTSYDAGYTDVVDGKYYSDAVNWAAEEGVVTGYTNGKFGVNDTLSFEQMCLIIARYANGGDDVLQSAVSDSAAAKVLAGYSDGGSVAAYADNGMAWCINEGLVTGNTDGTILPQQDVTRQRAAVVVARWQGLVD